MATRDPADKRKFVIVGGGPAGLTCAVTLRQCGYTGEIQILTSESLIPYDRTLLTKALPTGDAKFFALRKPDILAKHGIDVQLNSKVNHINAKDKTVELENGSKVSFDKLCIATGQKSKNLGNIANHSNVFTIREHDD